MKPIYALLLLVILPVLLMAQQNSDRGYIVKCGEMAPDFNILYPDGHSIPLSSLRGKVVMLQFTASWCGVCRREMPYIEAEIWQQYKNDNLIVLGIDRGETVEKVNSFAKKTGITYPLTMDEEIAIFKLFAHEKAGVTRNILIDKTGKIVYLTRLFEREEFNALKEAIVRELRK